MIGTTRKGYMDLTDFGWELEAAPSNIIYRDPEDILKDRKCATECGIAEVEVIIKRIVLEPHSKSIPIPSFTVSENSAKTLE